MQTKVVSADDDSIKLAAELIKASKVVGMPTETVYGLAANALDEKAVSEIFKAKGRPADNPLIVHISNIHMIEPLVAEFPEIAKKCAEAFWGGPLTMILPKSDLIPKITSGGLDTVGIRFPANKAACRLIDSCGVPLAAPSANLSGSPSPTTAAHVFDDMNGRIELIIDDGKAAIGVESTVICFTENGEGIRILRPGFISPDDFFQITDKVYIDSGVLHKVDKNAKVSSPGMKYKHYSPKCEVFIIKSNVENFEKFAENLKSDEAAVSFKPIEKKLLCKNLIFGENSCRQAENLFDILRSLDDMNMKKAYFMCPNEDGVGLAVMNRLLRAAAFNVIEI